MSIAKYTHAMAITKMIWCKNYTTPCECFIWNGMRHLDCKIFRFVQKFVNEFRVLFRGPSGFYLWSFTFNDYVR